MTGWKGAEQGAPSTHRMKSWRRELEGASPNPARSPPRPSVSPRLRRRRRRVVSFMARSPTGYGYRKRAEVCIAAAMDRGGIVSGTPCMPPDVSTWAPEYIPPASRASARWWVGADGGDAHTRHGRVNLWATSKVVAEKIPVVFILLKTPSGTP